MVLSDPGVSQVSLHPVHLKATDGPILPSAFIPVCAYQTDMKSLGEEVHNLDFITCNQFKPVVLEGHLCYSSNLQESKSKLTKAGKKHGFLFVLDKGTEHAEEEGRRVKSTDEQQKIEKLDLETSSKEETAARIYIHTLGRYSDYRPGSFGIAALKNMTTTKSFMEFPESVRKCQVEMYEECQTKEFLKSVVEKCGCLPWVLSTVEDGDPQVTISMPR